MRNRIITLDDTVRNGIITLGWSCSLPTHIHPIFYTDPVFYSVLTIDWSILLATLPVKDLPDAIVGKSYQIYSLAKFQGPHYFKMGVGQSMVVEVAKFVIMKRRGTFLDVLGYSSVRFSLSIAIVIRAD